MVVIVVVIVVMPMIVVMSMAMVVAVAGGAGEKTLLQVGQSGRAGHARQGERHGKCAGQLEGLANGGSGDSGRGHANQREIGRAGSGNRRGRFGVLRDDVAGVFERVPQVVDVVQPFQRRDGVQLAEKVDVAEANAALARQKGPVVAGGVVVHATQLLTREALGQHDVGCAPLGDEPVAALVARLGEIDESQAIARHRRDGVAKIHFVTQNEVAGKSDQVADVAGLVERAVDQRSLGPVVADGARNDTEPLRADLVGHGRVKPQSDLPDGRQAAGKNEGAILHTGLRVGQALG